MNEAHNAISQMAYSTLGRFTKEIRYIQKLYLTLQFPRPEN